MISDLLRPKMIQTLALLLAISYVGVAARRWRPAMLFDAAMLALVLWRPYPALLAFVLWLIGVRWLRGCANWMVAAFQLDTFPGHTAALARFLLPASDLSAPPRTPITGATVALMSRSEMVPTGVGTGSGTAGTGSGDPVLAQQYHVEPIEPCIREPDREPSALRNLSRQNESVMLAVQRNDDGSYRHSANDIAKFVGGTRADVLSWVAAIRGKKETEPASAIAQRPKGGW